MVRDVKQASFRLNSEDTERFKTFCEENDLTAAQGFAVLMEIMELDRAGKALPARKTEIENFEQLTKSMVSAYLHSLELNENAENRVREQFSMQLESQARTITNYQEQVSALQLQLEEAENFAESYRSDLTVVQESLAEADKLRLQFEVDLINLKEDRDKQLSDKDNIIAMLTEKMMVVEQKANRYDALDAENFDLKANLAQAEQTIKDNQKDAQIALERAVRDAEKVLEAEHRMELERLRSQNSELLQTIAINERNFNEQIRVMDKTNADLREIIAELRAQLSKHNDKENEK